MKTTRKRYSADFKAKVALEAIRGDLTLADLAAKHGVHHTMIASWKRQAIDGMASTFSGAGDAGKGVSESEVEKLHAKIGRCCQSNRNSSPLGAAVFSNQRIIRQATATLPARLSD